MSLGNDLSTPKSIFFFVLHLRMKSLGLKLVAVTLPIIRSMGKPTTWSKFLVSAFLNKTYLYTFTNHHLKYYDYSRSALRGKKAVLISGTFHAINIPDGWKLKASVNTAGVGTTSRKKQTCHCAMWNIWPNGDKKERLVYCSFHSLEFEILLFIRPSSDGTYYGMVMSVRPSGSPSVRPSVTVFRTFLLHALTYWSEILCITLFLCT